KEKSATENTEESPTRTSLIFFIGILAIFVTFALLRYVSNIFNSFLGISGAMAAFAPVVLLPVLHGVLANGKSEDIKRPESRAVLLFILFLVSSLVQFGLFM